MSEFSRAKGRVARKDHPCAGCQNTIRKGDVYKHTVGYHDHMFWSVRECKQCSTGGC